MKKTWVKNIIVAAVTLALVLGVCGVAMAAWDGIPTTTETISLETGYNLGPLNTAGENWTYTVASGADYIDVNAAGLVTPKKNTPSGTYATVSITNSTLSPSQSKTVQFIVKVNASISLSTNAVLLGLDQTTTPTATVVPSWSAVTWSSNNTNVATVDSSGVITGTGEGTATITATLSFDPSKTATVTVTGKLPTIAVSGQSAVMTKAGDVASVTATLTQNGSTSVTDGTSVTWTSSNTNVFTLGGATTATTSFSGGTTSTNVTAVATGTATLTCTSNVSGKVVGTRQITVGNPTPAISLSFSPDVTGLGHGNMTTMNIHVDNPVPNASGQSWVKITRATRRVYVQRYYEGALANGHPSREVYYALLDGSGNASVDIYPQYNGSVRVTVEATNAVAQSRTFTVTGYPTLPQGGQDFTLIYVLGACCLAAAAAWVVVYAKKKNNTVA